MKWPPQNVEASFTTNEDFVNMLGRADFLYGSFFWIVLDSGFPDSQISRCPDATAARTVAARQALRCQPNPFLNAPRVPICCKEPEALAATFEDSSSPNAVKASGHVRKLPLQNLSACWGRVHDSCSYLNCSIFQEQALRGTKETTPAPAPNRANRAHWPTKQNRQTFFL